MAPQTATAKNVITVSQSCNEPSSCRVRIHDCEVRVHCSQVQVRVLIRNSAILTRAVELTCQLMR